jgi:hypothetical protein
MEQREIAYREINSEFDHYAVLVAFGIGIRECGE